jgi:hypothetical protein
MKAHWLLAALATLGFVLACSGRPGHRFAPFAAAPRSSAAPAPSAAQSGEDGDPSGSDSADCIGPDNEAINEDRYCCKRDENGKLAHINEPFCRLFCEEENIYCVTETGDPLDDDVPPTLVSGQSVILRVVSDKRRISGQTFVLTGPDAARETRVQFGVRPKPKRRGVTAGGAGTIARQTGPQCTGSCEHYRVASIQVTAPDGAGSVSARLSVTDDQADRVVVTRNYEFPIQRGRFRVEAGIFVPITLNGSRTVSLAPIPGTGLSSIEVTEDVSWALGLNVVLYPFGVFDKREDDNRDWFVRDVLSPLGIGFGTNVFSEGAAFREGYISLNYRIARGAIVGVGTSIVQGEFLTAPYAEGAVVAGALPSGAIEKQYMFRPHVSLTLSADVIASLFQLLSTVNSVPSGGSGDKGSR